MIVHSKIESWAKYQIFVIVYFCLTWDVAGVDAKSRAWKCDSLLGPSTYMVQHASQYAYILYTEILYRILLYHTFPHDYNSIRYKKL